MQNLIKAALIAAPAAVLMIYVWSGQAHKMEARQQVESAGFDRDWEESQADFAVAKDAKAKHLARAAAAQAQISSAQAKARLAEEKAAKQDAALEKSLDNLDKDLDGIGK